MNSATLRKWKNDNSTITNFRIIIQRKGSRDDGRGYATTKEEAVRRFDSVMKKCSNYLSAELWYENEKSVEILVKKI